MTYSLKPYRMLISLDIDKEDICKCCIFKEETDGGLFLPCWDELKDNRRFWKRGLCKRKGEIPRKERTLWAERKGQSSLFIDSFADGAPFSKEHTIWKYTTTSTISVLTHNLYPWKTSTTAVTLSKYSLSVQWPEKVREKSNESISIKKLYI